MVPAMIVQPFIENAIWHGIVPKEAGGRVNVSVKAVENKIVCEIDDDGIGRALSQKNKPASTVVHESKGVRLSQARINLDKLLNDNETSIEIFDKNDGEKATGTLVVLRFDTT
jgi:sensor histidine kinase YesM